jgi:hypothetical protein
MESQVSGSDKPFLNSFGTWWWHHGKEFERTVQITIGATIIAMISFISQIWNGAERNVVYKCIIFTKFTSIILLSSVILPNITIFCSMVFTNNNQIIERSEQILRTLIFVLLLILFILNGVYFIVYLENNLPSR